ncbi:MAG: sensor histidine kinase [Alicyclobacillus sp.]|nr:sensor histidine kinase [Alicyclobacillus sp.]
MVFAELPVFDETDAAIKLLEEERRRIARDLHDGPAQALTNISMRLDVIRRLFETNPELALEDLARTNSRVVAVINDIRRLIYDLRPVAIDEVGLLSATKEFLRRCESEWRIAFHLTVGPGVTTDIAPAKQVALYRLIQEILNNVHKHAAATEVTVQFERSGEELRIRIADNGKGFDPEAIPQGHFGILGMRERARFLHGRLEIDSQPGKGSRFTLFVPVYRE